MASGAAIYFLFAYTPALQGVANAFAPLSDSILPVFMFCILFVTFCKVDFHRLVPVRWHLWIGVLQIVFVATVMGAILMFNLRGGCLIVAESVITCIIGPCAAAAAVVTAKLGGSLEEMTTYVFLSNFLTAILIPVCFPLIERGADISFFPAFLKIMYEVCMVLLLPMLLAYIVKHFLRQLHRRITGVKDLSYYLWGASLMIVTGTTVRNIVHADTTLTILLTIAGACLATCLMQFAAGRMTGAHFGSAINAGQALGQKNTAFAIWIASSYLNPLSSVGPGCYILWQNIINSVEIWDCRRKGLERNT